MLETVLTLHLGEVGGGAGIPIGLAVRDWSGDELVLTSYVTVGVHLFTLCTWGWGYVWVCVCVYVCVRVGGLWGLWDVWGGCLCVVYMCILARAYSTVKSVFRCHFY